MQLLTNSLEQLPLRHGTLDVENEVLGRIRKEPAFRDYEQLFYHGGVVVDGVVLAHAHGTGDFCLAEEVAPHVHGTAN